MKETKKISAVIITFNEERNIERCILSIKDFVEEIVVVDSYSTDGTESICKKYDVRFIQNKFEGHIEQKNFAMQQASNDYVLSLDADEAVDEQLKKSITAIKSTLNEFASYSFNRLTNYCGKWIKHCGWYPDSKTRLWDKTKGSWGGTNPHDSVVMKAIFPKKHLKGDLLHYSYYTVDEHIKQSEKFALISAKADYKKGKKSSQFLIIIKPILKFWGDYIFRLGILDGRYGYTICKISASAKKQKYKEILLLQKEDSK